MPSDALPSVPVDRLVIGLYIHLDLRWMEHPFPFNHFKIRDAEQLQVLRSLGKREFRYDPARSDASPAPVATPAPPPAQAATEISPIMQAKLARIERIRQQRTAILNCEKTFQNATSTVKNLTKNLFSKPQESVEAASDLIETMVESMLTDRDIAIHLMNDKIAGEEVYMHSLNVSVLAMILGKELKLAKDKIQVLGMGGLFHDIGKLEVPDKILLKNQPLNHAEEGLLREHVNYGVEIAKRIKLPAEVVRVIAEHHEFMDGSGYPKALSGDAISIPSRITALVNAYDGLCNPRNIRDAITPHEALSQLFAKQRKHFDNDVLNVMIRSLGVYPPGTVVLLSNEALGMVMSVNSSKPLKPTVMVYDPTIPKDEAMIIDLESETDLNISKALRPGQLPAQVYEYLSPRKRTTYYFDANEKA